MGIPGVDMPRVDLGDVDVPRIPVEVPEIHRAARVDLAAVGVPTAAAGHSSRGNTEGRDGLEDGPPSLLRDEVPEAAFALFGGGGTAAVSTTEPDVPRKSLRIRVAPRVSGGKDEAPFEAEEDNEPGEGGERTDPGGIYAMRYSIEEALGATPGLSRYLAVQEPSVRRVVLTVLRSADRTSEAQDALESRFLRDARLLARLKCTSLAPTYDAGRSGDGTVFQTEEVPYGPSLRHLSDTGALTPDQLLAVVRAVASGLAAMHEAGVPHRCLRGDAVTVPRPADGAGAAAVVGRYGLHVLSEDIASAVDPESVMAWPPESLGGHEPDEAADVYAFGVLLYHALAKRPPYAGTAEEVRAARLAGPPASLPRAAGLAGQLTLIAERCLQESPEARYPTARALIEALDAAARVSAPPPPPAPRVVAPAPARRSFAATAAMLAAGAAIPSVVLLALLVRQFTSAPAEPPGTALSGGPAIAAAPVESGPAAPVEPAALVSAPAAIVEAPALIAAAPAAATVAAVKAPPAPVAPPKPEVGSRPPPAVVPTAARVEPRAVAVAAPPTPVAIVAAPTPIVEPTPVAEPTPVTIAPEPVAVAPLVPVPAPPAAPVVAGASDLTGLWLGKVTGGTLALDLQIGSDGRVQGRARRSDRPGEARVSGRVTETASGLQVDFSVVSGETTDSYSALMVDGALQGRISEDGKSAGKFSARR